MGFGGHFAELRKRIFLTAIFFVAFLVVGVLAAKPLIVFFEHAPAQQHFSWLPFVEQSSIAKELSLNAFRPTDPLYVFLGFAFIIAFILTGPLLLYQVWAFISPGLYENERRITLGYIPVTILMFLLGIAFGYFLLFPYVIHFMISLADDMQVKQTFGIHQYFMFLFQITIPFGFVFQLPLLSMFLTRLGIITPSFLHKIRKYAYFVLLIIAGLITPPDVISQLIVMVPLGALYELSIFVSRFAYRKVLRAQGVVHHE